MSSKNKKCKYNIKNSYLYFIIDYNTSEIDTKYQKMYLYSVNFN